MSGASSRRCLAMIEAGIDDANSQEGIDFCVNRCPYDSCVIFEGRRGRGRSREIDSRRRDRITKAREMAARGVSIEEIAIALGVSSRTARRYLELGA